MEGARHLVRRGIVSHFSCVIQEGSAAEAATDTLERRLDELHRTHFPDESTSVSWRSVPPGYMFTEGRQSTSSIIACVIGHETTLAQRERYMRGVCDLWSETTGCTDHEIVVAITAIDPG